jgi:putative membrane protein
MVKEGTLEKLSEKIMKDALNDQERTHLDKRIAEAERRTSAQIVLAVIERSDSYPELPWKAFALGVSIAGFAAVILDMLCSEWTSNFAALLAVTIALAAGAACALLCVFVPWFGRLFLSAHRAEAEVRQHAQSLFLTRELFSTHQRTGVLLLISLFERQVVILPDTGLHNHLNQGAMQKIIACMSGALSSCQFARALEDGLNALEKALTATTHSGSGENELSNSIIEEKGI